jgi:hypothetical protein
MTRYSEGFGTNLVSKTYWKDALVTSLKSIVHEDPVRRFVKEEGQDAARSGKLIGTHDSGMRMVQERHHLPPKAFELFPGSRSRRPGEERARELCFKLQKMKIIEEIVDPFPCSLDYLLLLC